MVTMKKPIKTIEGTVVSKTDSLALRPASVSVAPPRRKRQRRAVSHLEVPCLLCPAKGTIEVRFGRLLAKVCQRCADGVVGGAQFLSWASKLFGGGT